MKNFLFVISMMFVSFNVQAVELKDVEGLVKGTVIQSYTRGWKNDVFTMNSSDVWDLRNSGKEPGCELMVEGFAKKPAASKLDTARFWVCVKQRKNGSYSARLVDDKIINQ